MAEKTRAQLLADIAALFADNDVQAISEADLRQVTGDLADSAALRKELASGNVSPAAGDLNLQRAADAIVPTDLVGTGNLTGRAAGDLDLSTQTYRYVLKNDATGHASFQLLGPDDIAGLSATIAAIQLELGNKLDIAALGYSSVVQALLDCTTTEEMLQALGFQDLPASWDGGLIGPQLDATTGVPKFVRYEPEEVHAMLARTIDGGEAGANASGPVDLDWAPGLSGWRRNAIGNVVISQVNNLPETAGKQQFIFRQGAGGGWGLTIGTDIVLKGDADVSLDAGQETVFDVFAAGEQVFMERITPVVGSYWTHNLTIEVASTFVGFGTGFGAMSPDTIVSDGPVFEYFYAADAAPLIRVRLVGGVQPYTSLTVEFENLVGTFSFSQLPSGRYGMAGGVPGADTLANWITARAGQSVNLRIVTV